jgi:mannan endo-1,4-beta-mannosidase
MRKTTDLLLLILTLVGSSVWAQQSPDFVTTKDGVFYHREKPYYYIGTNYWYGAVLGSAGEGGDRERLKKELDFLKGMGVTNLRVLAGAEGPNDQPSRVPLGAQQSPGVYDEKLLEGLDYLLVEMGKRGMKAVLFLGNSWEWSGGYAQYLNWNGYGDIPYPNLEQYSWPDFMKYVNEFHKSCTPCKEQYNAFVKFMVTRKNTLTGLDYRNDSAIMTWEIANEPRAFSKENFDSFVKWLEDVSVLIKSLDPNHLVTTGTEGSWGCEGSIEVFEKTHAYASIDYLTMHIWPKNWSWLDIHDINGSLPTAILKTNEYMIEHIRVAERLKKPLVLEEFGLPRDHHKYSLEDPTTARDAYYENAFSIVLTHAKTKGVLAGCNFWAFSGTARPVPGQPYWKKGDPFMGDPPQEEQGLNSVFDTDTTIKLIRTYTRRLSKTR